ncbi:hypothetical protein GCM10022247_34730 [Allokutzneria multivorans]|uniref:Uncharacterized protein n=1 Tax=Allokutzneria multivorans TaxID=1142134 RepID=A0ABP7SBZ6_9PSEU
MQLRHEQVHGLREIEVMVDVALIHGFAFLSRDSRWVGHGVKRAGSDGEVNWSGVTDAAEIARAA